MRAYPVTTLLKELPSQRPATELLGRLDEALATKLVGMLRCRRHHFMARRNGSLHAVDMFLAHSNLEQAHADAIAGRIVELHAEPGFSPIALLNRSHVAFFEPGSGLAEMAQEDLDATRTTAGILTALVRFVGTGDGATRHLLLAILEADRARANELAALLSSLKRR